MQIQVGLGDPKNYFGQNLRTSQSGAVPVSEINN